MILSKTCHVGKTWASHLRRMQHQDIGQGDDNDDDPNDEMKIERSIAKEIMDIVNQRGLPLILDKLTEGKGNCFPIAILDQCKRPEILKELSVTTKAIVKQETNRGQMQLRTAVKFFIRTSKHPNVAKYKAEYQATVAQANKENWDKYWTRIVQNEVWADYTFIQLTAWYLNHDIMIVNTTNNDDNPVIVISGNMADQKVACPGAMLTIGSKSNCHYQSLLPIEIFHLNSEPEAPQTNMKDNTKEKALEENTTMKSQVVAKFKIEMKQDENSKFIYKCFKC